MKAFHEMTWEERLTDAKERHAKSIYKSSLFVDERLVKQIHRMEIETALTFNLPVPSAVLVEYEKESK